MLTRLLKKFFSLFQPAAARPQGVAANLMDRAEACSGQDPHRAAELREAAQAYLGVVR